LHSRWRGWRDGNRLAAVNGGVAQMPGRNEATFSGGVSSAWLGANIAPGAMGGCATVYLKSYKLLLKRK